MKKSKVINIIIIVCLVLLVACLIAEFVLAYGDFGSDDEEQQEETSFVTVTNDI